MTPDEMRAWLAEHPDDPPACPHGLMAGPCESCLQERAREDQSDATLGSKSEDEAPAGIVAEIDAELRHWEAPHNAWAPASTIKLLQRARDELAADHGCIIELGIRDGENIARIAALEAQLAAQAAVIEAAKTWEKLTRNDRGKHGDEICRNLQQAIRALPIVDKDDDATR